MSKISKRWKIIQEKVTPGKVYSFEEAVELLKSCPPVKFNESVDVAVILGVDAKKSDQLVRSSVVLPHGTGRTLRVAVFTQGDQAEVAKNAGADVVGFEDLAEDIKKGTINFDVLIATPDAMRVVGQLGQILGPKGLMPNPKVGTVTQDVAGAVRNAKSGQVQYRTDKAGVVHCTIGKLNFAGDFLKGNLAVFVADLKKMKPASSKGVYLRKLVLSSTMGPGLVVDLTTIGG